MLTVQHTLGRQCKAVRHNNLVVLTPSSGCPCESACLCHAIFRSHSSAPHWRCGCSCNLSQLCQEQHMHTLTGSSVLIGRSALLQEKLRPMAIPMSTMQRQCEQSQRSSRRALQSGWSCWCSKWLVRRILMMHAVARRSYCRHSSRQCCSRRHRCASCRLAGPQGLYFQSSLMSLSALPLFHCHGVLIRLNCHHEPCRLAGLKKEWL